MSMIRTGKPANPNAIKAMAKRNKGIPGLQETKDKQSAKMIGRAHSEETRNKLSIVQKGKPKGPRSEKAKASISVAMRLVWQQRKIKGDLPLTAE